MNMIDFGYVIALALITMIASVRGYPLVQRLRTEPLPRWLGVRHVVREETELSVGRAESAPPRYV